MPAQDPTRELPAKALRQGAKNMLPRWIAPMLATLREEPFTREGWLFEPKLDGIRCLAVRDGRSVQLLSRNQKLLNGRYPELVDALEAQRVRQFVIDGEVVAFKGGLTSFATLQLRMQVEHPPDELRQKIPVWYYAFDILNLNGYDIRHLRLHDRKTLLKQAFDFQGRLRFTEHLERNGEAYYRQACRKGWEGIIGKNGDSPYVSRRSLDWLKFKCVNEQEFVVGGYTDPEGTRVGFGALLVGYYENGRLVYAGKVGTGYDMTTLRSLQIQLNKLEISQSPFTADGLPTKGVHWVKPKLVVQLGFAEWTAAGKLRQPRFLGLRYDKKPEEVVRESKAA